MIIFILKSRRDREFNSLKCQLLNTDDKVEVFFTRLVSGSSAEGNFSLIDTVIKLMEQLWQKANTSFIR